MQYLLLLLVLFSSTLFAADDSHYERISLSATASEKVAEDLMIADLYIQHEGNNVATLTDKLNKQMTQALNMAKKVSSVIVRSGQYSTSPVYSKAKIDHWRVKQTLKVESQNFSDLQNLLSQLQSVAHISSISFKVSDDKSEATRSLLINKAIENFKQRAQQVTNAFGHKTYRIVSVDIQTFNSAPPRPVMYARAMVADAPTMRSSPAISSGKEKIEVQVNGSIELQVQ